MAKKAAGADVIGPVFQVRDLTAGVNLRPTPTTIKPNQALFLQNTLISNVGELALYPGYKSFSALPNYRTVVLGDSPTAYYRLDEASGNFVDIVNAFNGTPNGGITRQVTGATTQDGDTAVTLNGTTGYISVADVSALRAGSGNFSVEAWVKLTNTGDNPIVNKFTGGSLHGWLLSVNGEGGQAGKLDFYSGTGGGWTHSSASVNDGSYHHVVATIVAGTPGTVKLYVDGVLDTTNSINTAAMTDTAAMEMGRRADLPTFYTGSLDEVAVYIGTVLTAAQVTAHFNAASQFASRRIQGARRVYLKGGVQFTVVADNGSVYKPDDLGSNWPVAVLSGLNATNDVDFVHDRILVSAFDGSTTPQKSLDGSTWTQLGITAPAAAPTLTVTAGGSLVAGDIFEVTYTYLNSTLNEESNESAVQTATPMGGNQTIHVVTVASADAQVDKIKVYARDKTVGESVRRLVTTIANGATTDLTTDNWTTGAPSPTVGANSVALPMKFGTVWKNRMWGVDATVGNRIRFTQVFQHVWPDTFFVDIPFERGEGITALVPLGDILIVFGTTKFYLILGQTSLDFEVRPALGAQSGAAGFRAVDILEAAVVHGSGPGVYLYNGATEQLLSYLIQPAWNSMMGSGLMTSTEFTKIPIAHHKLQKEIRVGVPLVFPTGARGEWIMDLNRTNAPAPQGESNQTAWFATDRPIGGYVQWDGNEANPNNQGRIFSWSPTQVRLFEERTGTSADGSDLTMQYQGYMLPFGLQSGRVIETYLEYQPAAQTQMSASLIVDGTTQGPITFTLFKATTSVYGTAKYATGTYGGGAIRTTIPITWPLAAEGYSAQLRLKYIGQGTPKFYTYGHSVVQEPVPRGL